MVPFFQKVKPKCLAMQAKPFVVQAHCPSTCLVLQPRTGCAVPKLSFYLEYHFFGLTISSCFFD